MNWTNLMPQSMLTALFVQFDINHVVDALSSLSLFPFHKRTIFSPLKYVHRTFMILGTIIICKLDLANIIKYLKYIYSYILKFLFMLSSKCFSWDINESNQEKLRQNSSPNKYFQVRTSQFFLLKLKLSLNLVRNILVYM